MLRSALLLITMFAVASPLLGDTVKLKNGQSLTGQITRYDDRGVEIRIGPSGNLARMYTADEVDAIETTLSPAHEKAHELLAAANYRQAAHEYIAAFRAESRNWVKSWIRIDLLAALRGAGEYRKAAELFLEIAADRDDRDAVALAPLLWLPQTPIDDEACDYAKRWIQSERLMEKLIGASWLLGTEASAAQGALEQLASDSNPEIAEMARLQLWRTKLEDKSTLDLRSLAEAVVGIPRASQAGPQYLLATGYEKQGQPVEAALMYLRVAWNEQAPTDLRAEALLAAAQQAEAAGYADDAQRLFSAVIQQFPNTPPAKKAAAMDE